MKRKSEIGIGRRMVEELFRLYPDDSNVCISRRLGCDKRTLSAWTIQDNAPSAMFLACAASLGADVEYILTGRRKTKEKPPDFLAEYEEEYD